MRMYKVSSVATVLILQILEIALLDQIVSNEVVNAQLVELIA